MLAFPCCCWEPGLAMAEETKVPGAIGNSDLVWVLCWGPVLDPGATGWALLATGSCSKGLEMG